MELGRFFFGVNFGYGGPKAWNQFVAECKSWASGSKLGGPKYWLLLTATQCMCGDVQLVNNKGVQQKWKRKLKTLSSYISVFENRKRNLLPNMFLVLSFKENENKK